MKTKTKILIVVLFVVLYSALIIVVKNAESKHGEPEEYRGLTGLRRKYSIEIDYDKAINDNLHLFDLTDKDLVVDLKKFKRDEEYYFGDMLWNITFEQVKNIVSYSLIEDTSRIHLPEGYVYYVSEDNHELYEQTATATYEFYEDQLKMVQLTFLTDDKKTKKLFNSIIEGLTDICGQESIKSKDDNNVSVRFRWNGESTMLQVDMIASRVIISVGLVEAQ